MEIFLFIRSIFKKLVMAFNARNLTVPEKVVTNDQDSLTLEEIQLILASLRNSTFKGEHVELLYNTVLKLQNQYIKQQK
jgi:hypothetical protein